MAVQLTSKLGTWKLPDGDLILGRHSQADLHIDDIRLSRRHAEFRVNGNELVVKDLGSVNGVLVNGDRIKDLATLNNGDLVVIGPLAFTVEVDEETEAHARLEHDQTGYQRQTSKLDLVPDTDRQLRRSSRERTDDYAALHHNHEPPSSEAILRGDMRTTMPLMEVPVPGATDDDSTAKRVPTDQLLPDQGTPLKTDALLPNDPRAALVQELRAIRLPRLLAGWLDPASYVLLAFLVAVPLALAGFVWAMQDVGAGVVDGAITLPADEADELAAAGPVAIVVAAYREPDDALRSLEQLHGIDRPAFIIFFIAATLAILAVVLILLFGLIAATMLKGAPFWHRRAGLAIREQGTGYYPTAWRSLLRWVLVALLGWTAPLSILLGRRSLHDVLSGCRVCRTQFDPTTHSV